MGKEKLMSASWPSPQSLLWSDTKLSNMIEAGPFQKCSSYRYSTLLFLRNRAHYLFKLGLCRKLYASYDILSNENLSTEFIQLN